MITKKCTKCKKDKKLIEFRRTKKVKCGFRSWCKDCEREFTREYYKKNKEEIREKTKDYRKEYYQKVEKQKRLNGEYNKKKRDKYRKDNSEKANKNKTFYKEIKKTRKIWNERNISKKDIGIEKESEWYKEFLEKKDLLYTFILEGKQTKKTFGFNISDFRKRMEKQQCYGMSMETFTDNWELTFLYIEEYKESTYKIFELENIFLIPCNIKHSGSETITRTYNTRKWDHLFCGNKKICKSCGEEKPRTEFRRKVRKLDMLSSDCKDCLAEQENTDSHRENKKRYYEENKERILQKNREYHHKNKERMSEYKKKYREENKEQFKERDRIYRENNKENIGEKRYKQTARIISDKESEAYKKRKEKNRRESEEISKLSKKYPFLSKIFMSKNLVSQMIKKDMNSKFINEYGDFTRPELIRHLRSQFVDGMTLSSYGKNWCVKYKIARKHYIDKARNNGHISSEDLREFLRLENILVYPYLIYKKGNESIRKMYFDGHWDHIKEFHK